MTDQNIDGARKAAAMLLYMIKQVSDPEYGRESYRQEAFLDTANIEADPERGEWVVADAENGDAQAAIVVRQVIARRLIDGDPLPEPLLTHTLRILLGEKVLSKRGRSAKDYRARDYLIVHAVNAVVPYGFQPTRNRSHAERPSACSIVAKVMADHGVHMTEANVEAIYARRYDLVRD